MRGCSSILAKLAKTTIERRAWILAIAAALVVVSAVLGLGLSKQLKAGGFDDPQSESSVAQRHLAENFGINTPNFTLLIDAGDASVDDAAVARAALGVVAEVRREASVTDVISYWETKDPTLKSDTGDKALVLARIGGSEDSVQVRASEIAQKYEGAREDDISVRATGSALVLQQLNERTKSDLLKAELISLPLVFLALVLVFGGLVAAAIPVVLGGVTIAVSAGMLYVVSSFTSVSIHAMNVTTMLGLGLSIDYCLFVIARYREELRNGAGHNRALSITMRTAGRAVLFSALTVAISMSALLVFPQYFLRSFAYTGIGATLVAAAAALVLLPALLSFIGSRIDKWAVMNGRFDDAGDRTWESIARFVMRRPLPIAAVAVVLLMALGSPSLQAIPGRYDDRMLPPDASSHQVADEIRTDFTSGSVSPILVVVPDSQRTAVSFADISQHARILSDISGVVKVQTSESILMNGALVASLPQPREQISSSNGALLTVTSASFLSQEETGELVERIRAVPAPFDAEVTGAAAELVDSNKSLLSRMPLAAAIIGVTTLVLLFLMTGSVLIPIKALVLTLLSLSATFGAIVWVFQEGHLSSILDFTPTGAIDMTNPILMFCVAFGLSMDYQVFLLARIKEEYDRSGDNVSSVILGLSRTGRLISAGALLVALVAVSFATSGVTFVKLIGLGLALAVIVDATIVRGLLVPAFMKMFGKANWWAPGPLRRFHERYGFSESPVDAPSAKQHNPRIPL